MPFFVAKRQYAAGWRTTQNHARQPQFTGRAMTEMFSGTLKEEPQTFTIRLTPKEMNNEVDFPLLQTIGHSGKR